MELPKRPDQHVTGDQGAIIIRSSLPPKWVYRDLERAGDYGFDGEVEIFDETPSGLLFRVQIRSHARLQWNLSGDKIEPVKESTRNYWRLHATPVVLIACDVSVRAAYWAFADDSETSGGVRIQQKNLLASTPDALRSGVAERLNVLGPNSLLLVAPLIERNWNEINDSTERDFFLSVDEELLVSLKMVYGQIPLLRYAVGLKPASLVPWGVWVGKSNLGFGDYEELYCAVFDEIVDYLRPVVAETLDEAARILAKRDPLSSDVGVVNWALRRSGSNMSWAYSHSFAADRLFWHEFDQQLQGLGVKHFSASEAFDRKKKNLGP